jgi:nicotinamide-nucleotide amidase
MANTKASIITIGDELLIGQTIDTNSAWIAQRLNELGIDVVRRVAVGDTKADIIEALDTELNNCELVLITGGLGPTADDITKPLLNEYFGGTMQVHEPTLQHVQDLFTRRNRPFLERNIKQAELPDNCIVLFNQMGTAPGMWFDKDNKVIIAMPGVPFEMMSIMENEALPKLKERFITGKILHRSIITAGEGESFIAEKIQDLEEALPPFIKLAYLPGAGIVKLRLTAKGNDEEQLTTALNHWQSQIADRLNQITVALEDIPMEQIIGNLLKNSNTTIGLAESCTGGNIAHHFTQIMGASTYFCGSIVCYQVPVKTNVLGVNPQTIEQYGSVSQQTATEMAQGALNVFHTDYSFAITGLLSKGGESDKKPVGTVWMAVANKNRVATKEFHFHYDRLRNKEMATSMALLMIWKFINNRI